MINIGLDLYNGMHSNKRMPDPTQLPYVSSNDKNFASKTLANIYRAEWEDYKNRFMPYEQMLKGTIDNKQEAARLETMVRGNVNQSFGLADAQFTERFGQYGTGPSAIQQQVQNKTSALSKAAATADAVNNLRDHLKDRDSAVLAGGLGDVLVTNDLG